MTSCHHACPPKLIFQSCSVLKQNLTLWRNHLPIQLDLRHACRTWCLSYPPCFPPQAPSKGHMWGLPRVVFFWVMLGTLVRVTILHMGYLHWNRRLNLNELSWCNITTVTCAIRSDSQNSCPLHLSSVSLLPHYGMDLCCALSTDSMLAHHLTSSMPVCRLGTSVLLSYSCCYGRRTCSWRASRQQFKKPCYPPHVHTWWHAAREKLHYPW